MALSFLKTQDWQRIQGVLFDLDDTLLDEERILPEAYAALNALADSGLRLILCTGRPASWAEALCRILPVVGAVAENGAIGFIKQSNRVRRIDWGGHDRVRRRKCLDQLVNRALQRFTHLKAADDTAGRISDFTFDIGEFHHAPEAEILAAIELAHTAGARTTRSSVHLHYTFDRQDKATGSLRLLKVLGEQRKLTLESPDARLGDFDQTRARSEWAYIGDSENDAPCFAAFHCSVAVANLKGEFSLKPLVKTQSPRGAGFAEFADSLLLFRNNGQQKRDLKRKSVKLTPRPGR